MEERSRVCTIRGMDAPILIATASLAGVIIVATIALASLIAGIGRGIRQDANEDRRAIQAAMDAFRQEMQRHANVNHTSKGDLTNGVRRPTDTPPTQVATSAHW